MANADKSTLLKRNGDRKPGQRRLDAVDSVENEISQTFELSVCERLGHNVGELVLGRNVSHDHLAAVNSLADKMQLDVEVLDARVDHIVVRNCQ